MWKVQGNGSYILVRDLESGSGGFAGRVIVASASNSLSPRWSQFPLTSRKRGATMLDVILKRFEKPDELRVFEKGRFELVKMGGMTIGRVTYQPGWKWSVHVGAATGAKCYLGRHVGMVV